MYTNDMIKGYTERMHLLYKHMSIYLTIYRYVFTIQPIIRKYVCTVVLVLCRQEHTFQTGHNYDLCIQHTFSSERLIRKRIYIILYICT